MTSNNPTQHFRTISDFSISSSLATFSSVPRGGKPKLYIITEEDMQECANCQFVSLLGGMGANREAIHLKPAIEKFMQAKIARNLRPKYVTSLKQYLNQFARGRENQLVSEINLDALESWFASRNEAPATRNSNMGRLSSFFALAVKRGWAMRNPVDQMEKAIVDRKLPPILSVEQSGRLLEACPQRIKPFLVLALFAGIRPDEILRMTWEHVNLDLKFALVVSKTRNQRHVQLEFPIVKALARHKETFKKLVPSFSTVRRWRKEARELIGGKWDQDILRHTAASYLLARHGDAGKVSTMLGNSPKILLKDYNNPRAVADHDKFWQLMLTI